MRKVLRGYAKGKDGDLILIGTIPVPHSKDKASPRERQNKRHLIRQGARSSKRKLFVSHPIAHLVIEAELSLNSTSIGRGIL
jgi:hypothetical protein